MRIIITVIALAAFLPGTGSAENNEIRQRTTMDWEKGILSLEMTVPLELDQALFPQARGAAERRAEEMKSALFLEIFSSLALSSDLSVGEYLARADGHDGRGAYLAELGDTARRGVKTASVVAPDFRSLIINYTFPFYGAGGAVTPLFTHSQPLPLPEFPGYYATRAFTGLVIHAGGELPAFGKNTRVRCRPALLSRIFYLSARRTIEPVLTVEMVEPAVLKTRGMLAYVRSAAPEMYADRAGDRPLTVAAYAIYGTNDTDIVISEDAARMLLANEANRRLLREGRIVVIID